MSEEQFIPEASLPVYWRISRYRCIAPALAERAPLHDRVRFTLKWWLKERADRKVTRALRYVVGA